MVNNDTVGAVSGGGCCDAHAYKNWKDGKWHFLVGVWTNGNNVKCYIDKTCYSANGQYSTYGNTRGYGLTVGCVNDYNYNFNGNISDVRVYNRALTQEEVNTLYEYGCEYLGIQ